MIRIPSKITTVAPHLAPVPSKVQYVEPVRIRGRIKASAASWAELHHRALTHEGKNDLLWIVLFGARIGGNCDCREAWKKELMQLPPDFKNYFFWSVAIHNMVNVRLGKPQVNVDEARKIWATPSPAVPVLPGLLAAS
jgi:hypothetical protein